MGRAWEGSGRLTSLPSVWKDGECLWLWCYKTQKVEFLLSRRKVRAGPCDTDLLRGGEREVWGENTRSGREGMFVFIETWHGFFRSVLRRVSKEIPNGGLFPEKQIYFVTDAPGGVSRVCVQPLLSVLLLVAPLPWRRGDSRAVTWEPARRTRTPVPYLVTGK